MRIMLDTNVLLSALIFRSRPLERVIEVASSGGNELLLSSYVIGEAREVVARKWPSKRHALEVFLQHLSFEVILTPIDPEPGLFEIRDPLDYPVLYSAVIGAADIFITGDKDFEGVDIGLPEIMTPAQFLTRTANR